MDTQSYKTVSLKAGDIKKEWVVIDATDLVVGRLAARVALVLRGKNKASFTPHMDCGDNVIVINADKVRFTGKKMTDKVYVRHTGYPGGQRFATPKEVMAKKPTEVLRMAVKGMLPKNRLGAKRLGLPSTVVNRHWASCISEYHFGAGKDVKSQIYVGVSTGIAAAIIIDGKLFTGAYHSAGEIGHMVVERNGPACSCGRRGCLHAISSENAMIRHLTEHYAAHPEP
ncbi:MAG: 50S ribosomal protein L13, partial [Bacteroidales bacterium]|nr:50S ribosomal protein L13 [Bacteroidales bacterium]